MDGKYFRLFKRGENGHYPAGPAMKKLSAFLLTLACAFQFSAQAQEKPSYIAIEANSGKLLFSSNAEARRPVASLSQVATAMVTLDWVARTRLPLDTFITVPQEAFGLRAGNPMDLQPGDRLTLRDALYSTLLGADNKVEARPVQAGAMYGGDSHILSGLKARLLLGLVMRGGGKGGKVAEALAPYQ